MVPLGALIDVSRGWAAEIDIKPMRCRRAQTHCSVVSTPLSEGLEWLTDRSESSCRKKYMRLSACNTTDI